VNVTASTLPSQCSALKLEGPDGAQLNSGCLVPDGGHIGATTLPSDGTYTVLVGPTTTGTGTAIVQVIEDFDQTGTITPDGPSVTATIGQPGATSAFTFSEAPGTTVFVEVLNSTLPEQCGALDLVGPSGSDIDKGGCITSSDGGASGAGYIDPITIQASGTYTVLLHPSAPDMGSTVLKLIVEHDQVTPITIGGPSVTAAIALPGGQSELTFEGTAGQSVSVQFGSSTLPGACGGFELDSPGGSALTSACVEDGAGTIPAVKLPSTGQYTIVVDPGGLITGSVVVRLTSG
jgi:hypothetical protein